MSRFVSSAPIKRLALNLTLSASNAEAIAAVTGKKIRVLALDASIVTAAGVTVRSASDAISGIRAFGANGQWTLPFNEAGWFETARGEALNFIASTGTDLDGVILYQEVFDG